MAIDKTDLPSSAVGGQNDETDADNAESRYSADDFRLRLDSPLFHRDPGMSAAQAPQLRELTWEHVVRPNQQVLTHESDDRPAVVDARADLAEAVNEPAAPLPATDASTPSIDSLRENARGSAVQPRPVEAPRPAGPRYSIEAAPVTEGRDASIRLPDVEARHEPAVSSPAVSSPVVSPPASLTASPPQPVSESSLSAAIVAGKSAAPVSTAAQVKVAAPKVLAPQRPVVPFEAVPLEPEPRIESLLAAVEQMEAAGAREAAHEPAPAPAPSKKGAAPVVAPPAPAVRPANSAPSQDDSRTSEPDPPAASRIHSHISPVRPVAESAVKAELNRLAFLPDQQEEVGPVAVPAIAYTEPPPTPGAPALSQHEMYSPRPSPWPVHHRVNPIELATSAAPPRRKKKRHVLRRMVTLIVLLGLVGGGLFAAEYYLLDKHWSNEVKPLVGEVETARGLSFDHAIVVTSLPVDEYASKLASLSLGITEENTAIVAGEWRSLGLLNGALIVRSIGMSALPDSPAFYDATSETIFVADALPADLYRFGMQRALTLALLDQHYGWGKRVTEAPPSIARGTRAFYDADALATAVELTTATERTNVVTQIFGLYGTYQIAASPSPFATAVSGRLGLALRPYFESVATAERDTMATGASLSDGQVLDIRRLVSGAVEVPDAQSQGMLYWYHVLASRIDDDTAWRAALAWQNDEVAVVNGVSGPCVVALVQVDPASLDSVTAAFQAWAAAAPAESATTVAPGPGGSAMQLQINACDPGASVATNDGHGYLVLGGAPLRAEQYHQLLVAQPALPPTQAACAVYGGDSVSLADERGVIDNADGWPVPAAHPTPDPDRLGCAPA